VAVHPQSPLPSAAQAGVLHVLAGAALVDPGGAEASTGVVVGEGDGAGEGVDDGDPGGLVGVDVAVGCTGALVEPGVGVGVEGTGAGGVGWPADVPPKSWGDSGSGDEHAPATARSERTTGRSRCHEVIECSSGERLRLRTLSKPRARPHADRAAGNPSGILVAVCANGLPTVDPCSSNRDPRCGRLRRPIFVAAGFGALPLEMRR
jgi:hypothetical protein